LAERFTKAIEVMDYKDPKWKQVMNLEGLTRWMPGSTEGYDELEREARRLDMLSERA
jgi:phosphonate transport system substrate-binding protein